MNKYTIRISLATLGCKLNQAETETLSRQLAARGYTIVPEGSPADICLLNTCTVTATADAKARHWLRAARRSNPAAKIIACGCYGERDPEALRLAGADAVIGNDAKTDLPNIIAGMMTIPEPANTTPELLFGEAGRTRSFIKIQDGCRYGCAYCIVPRVRPLETSLPPEEIIAEILVRQQAGYKEVVLTGTKVGTYRHHQTDLIGLLQRILAETAVPRLRLSSLQPDEISPELLSLWHNDRLCRHFHLALQNGSDSVLRRMRRRYLTADYDQAIGRIKDMVPGAAVTTDIITGFPGETEAEFTESYNYCRDKGFARIHVFPYSRREGTDAAVMAEQVKDSEKKLRTRLMLALAAEAAAAFRSRLLGQKLTVLAEQRRGRYWTGLTDNYVKCYFPAEGEMTNEIITLEIKELYRDGLRGRITG